MKTLIVCYDDRRKDFAELTLPGTRVCAQRAGYRFIDYHASAYLEPYMQRVYLLQRHIQAGDCVIYADIDVLFKPNASLDSAFSGVFNVSSDVAGINTGFIAARPDPLVEKLLRVWADLGPIPDQWDQTTLKLMASKFAWVSKLITGISPAKVSNPHAIYQGQTGSLAHHVFGGVGGIDRLHKMLDDGYCK